MANDINGLGTQSATDPGSLRATKDSTNAAASNAEQRPAALTQTAQAKAVDSVSLSGNVQALKALEEKIQKLPDVNEKRVASIKAALTSGNYSIDDLVVADKLLGFDELFK